MNGVYRLEAGENGLKKGAIAVGGGIIDDQLAFRPSGEKNERDGTIKISPVTSHPILKRIKPGV